MSNRRSRECYFCGSLSSETAFGRRRRPFLVPDRCDDCAAELARAPRPEPTRKRMTRRAYRASLAHRNRLPQRDLIDLIVSSP